MPQIRKQHLKKRPDGRYACRYRDQWFYGATEEEALTAREEYKRREAAGIRPPSQVTVAEFGAAWLRVAKSGCRPVTYGGWAIHLDHLISTIGNVPVAEVTPLQVRSVYAEHYEGLSASYIKNARQLFTAMFDAAIAEGIRQDNPARHKTAAPHAGTTGGHRAITAQEREWIETLCTDHRLYPAVMVMLYAGLRPQEVKALDVSRDVDGGMIRLHQSAHVDGRRYVIDETGKTRNAMRTVPVIGPLGEVLKGRQGPLVTSAAGKQISLDTWRVVWRSYVNSMEAAINGMQKRWYGRTREHKRILAAGGQLPPWIPFTVRPYDLRHSFATFCRDHGVEMHTCIAWMGHADAKMIIQIYDEVTDTRSASEAARLNKLIGSQNGSQRKIYRMKHKVQSQSTRE